MQFLVEPLLADADLEQLSHTLTGTEAEWEPGHLTAGRYAKASKNNWQLVREGAVFEQLSQLLIAGVHQHPLVKAAALPLQVHSVLFSRTGENEGYGRHVDNAYMPGGRSDLSFTLFLSDPTSYDGGELVIERPNGEEAIKLPAGHAIFYPSSSLHRVEPVRRGVRYAAVGWLQSVVRSHEQRELLFELQTACQALAQRLGRCDELDLLYRCHSNLLRQWGG